MSKNDITNLKIKLNPLKDQFFLTDEGVIQKIIEFSDLKKTDVVLEIGAGVGNLTKEIAKKSGRVIAFEIDERFKPYLSKLPKNVEVHWENAWDFVQMHGKWRKKKEYNKVVSNPPYSFIEPFVHNLTFLDYDKVILLVPNRFLKQTQKWDIFGSFFKAEVLLEVPKESFYPVPKTNSSVINLVKLPDPLESKDLGLFLRQYTYKHEGQLVKNSLMEGLIKYNKSVFSKDITKNEAREIISQKKLPKDLLEEKPATSKIYELIGENF